jgi:ABC-type uncharacterized transport system substrate-binding protein
MSFVAARSAGRLSLAAYVGDARASLMVAAGAWERQGGGTTASERALMVAASAHTTLCNTQLGAVPMRRREFIALLGGGMACWPLFVGAQPAQRQRLVGVMTNLSQEDPETERRLRAFRQRLHELGWREGNNVRFEYRWGVGDADKHRQNARELVHLAPDVILAHGSTIMGPLHRAATSIPIVFVSVADPVAGGFVRSLSKPGGNTTGFTSFEYAQSGKWIELLKEIAPSVQQVAVVRDPEQVSGAGQMGAIQAASVPLRVDVLPVGTRDLTEIEHALQSLAARPNGGLIVTTAAWAQIHRSELIALAAQLRLPAVYPYRLFTSAGGLCCYSPDIVNEYREAAGYVARILQGEHPGELPVQTPTKYELVINLKTAKVLGLTVAPTLLARADEVIE